MYAHIYIYRSCTYYCSLVPMCVFVSRNHLGTWLIHMCDMTCSSVCLYISRSPGYMTHSYVWLDSCIYVSLYLEITWVHASFVCVTWVIVVCCTTVCLGISRSPRSYVRHDSFIWFICVTSVIVMCCTTVCLCISLSPGDMTHSYVWHAWFICVTWLIHTCDMSHVKLAYELYHRYEWVMSHVWISHITHIH